jgi:hypothetical protein
MLALGFCFRKRKDGQKGSNGVKGQGFGRSCFTKRLQRDACFVLVLCRLAKNAAVSGPSGTQSDSVRLSPTQSDSVRLSPTQSQMSRSPIFSGRDLPLE